MEINLREIKTYYINLPEDSERNKNFLNRISNSGFNMDRIERIEGIRKPGIPQDSVFIGCFHSQLKALKKGLENGLPFMVLEDDAEVNEVPDFIEIPESADVLYVGISSWGFTPSSNGNLAGINQIITERLNSDIARIHNMLSSHAILYTNRDYLESLIETLEKNLHGESIRSSRSSDKLSYYGGHMLPCDVIMANHQYTGEAYALRNPAFYQGDKHTYCTLIRI